MSSSPHGPPQLGADDIVRFSSAPHFLEEYEQNLKQGRLFVRTKRVFPPQSRINLSIEGPGVEWGVGARAVVLLSRSGYLGLQLEAFESEVQPTLALLVDEVRARQQPVAPPLGRRSAAPREEVTVIGAPPIAPETDGEDSESNAEDGTRVEANPYLAEMRPTAPPSPSSRSSGSPPLEDDPDDRIQRRLPVAPISDARTLRLAREATSNDFSGHPPVLDDLDDDVSGEAWSQAPVGLPPPSVPPERSADETVGLGVLPPAEPRPAALLPDPGIERARLALADASLRLPRATAGGVIRASDLADLLGLWLSGLRHGVITLLGGPDGEAGAEVTVKIASKRVVTLSARVVARAGDWVTLRVEDPSDVRQLLRDHAEEWREQLDDIAPREIASVPPPARVSEAPPAQAPAPRPAQPPGPGSAPSLQPVPPPPSEPPKPDVSSAPPAAMSEPPRLLSLNATPDDQGPVEPARVEGDALTFRSMRDLTHEIESNLKSGGLFAASEPLPIRSHRSLRVVVAGTDLGVRIEADVVFAAAGRVGFAVTGFTELIATLERIVKQGPGRASEPPPSVPPAQGVQSLPPGQSLAPPPGGAGHASVPPGEDDRRGGLPAEFHGRLGRPPSRDELLEPARLRIETEEDLDHTSVLFLFEHISRNRLRGVLTLKRKDETRTLYFHEGSVAFVEARPAIEEHCLGRILVVGKKLNDASLREAIERARAARMPLGRVLVSLGKISAATLVAALREQTRLKVEAAFDWSMGTFEWGPWEEPPTRADLVVTSGTGILVKYFRHLYEHIATSEIETLLAPNMGRILVTASDAELQSPVIGLQAKEMRYIELSIDGRRNIGEVITGSPLGRLASLRLIAFGLSIGILRFKDGSRRSPRTPEARPESDGRGYTAMKRSLEEDLKLLKEQNYFEILGVHWSAHYRTYPAAFAKLKAKLDPNRLELRDAPPPVQKLAREVMEVVESAYKTLMNEADRIRYRKQLFDATEREYSADMLVKQGEVLIMRGDRIGGIEAFETAVELSPSQRNRTLLMQAREGRSLT